MRIVDDQHDVAELLPVIKQCCNLLRELSAFPTYCAAALASHQVIANDRDWSSLPEWLQLLCLTACTEFIVSSDSDSSLASGRSGDLIDLQLTAAVTLLDLTALTSSMIPSAHWDPVEAAKIKGDKEVLKLVTNKKVRL